MAENALPTGQPVIGVAFDGTGYGPDGAIWGGEFLVADFQDFKRFAHLKYVPLPGGDAAIRKPARVALAYLWANKIEWDGDLAPVRSLCAEEISILKSQLRLNINTPLTSSMGRFFDAVASLCGVRQVVNYEAQAAIEFEALADPDETGKYEYTLDADPVPGSSLLINPASLIDAVIMDKQNGVPVSVISARFHHSIAWMVFKVCDQIRKEIGSDQVVLSGGVWQNQTLLQETYELLTSNEFQVHIHRKVPTNDGGLALGQAAVAIHRMLS
jgi:hydrogenase maturation protein HypF